MTKIYVVETQHVNDEGHTVKMPYLVEAVSVTDAETIITESESNLECFLVLAVKGTKAENILGKEKAELLVNFCFKTTVKFTDEDKHGKEKQTASLYFIFAENLPDAILTVNEMLKTVLVPWRISAISETKYVL